MPADESTQLGSRMLAPSVPHRGHAHSLSTLLDAASPYHSTTPALWWEPGASQ
jgi:hypothetical protein